MTAVSLKEAVETAIVNRIKAVATATGASLDPDLTANQQLNTVKGGFFLLPDNYKQGPLAVVKYASETIIQDEIGNGSEGRSVIGKAKVIVQGVTQHGKNAAQYSRDAGVMSEVITAALLNGFGSGAVGQATLTNNKVAYAHLLKWTSTGFDTVLAGGENATDKTDFVVIFTQEYELDFEKVTGLAG